MKVYRLREVVEEVEIDTDTESEALYQAMNGDDRGVIGLVRDVVVDAWVPEKDDLI